MKKTIYYPINIRKIDYSNIEKLTGHQQISLLVLGVSNNIDYTVTISVEGSCFSINPGDAFIAPSNRRIHIASHELEHISVLELYGDMITSVAEVALGENRLLIHNGMIFMTECISNLKDSLIDDAVVSVMAYDFFLRIQKTAVVYGTPATRYPAIVEAAVGIILNESSYLYSIEDIADRIGTSLSYLSREFKKATGVSPSQFLRAKKIKDAKELLTDETLSTTMIAEICGYSDADYFSRVFKQEVGVTPHTYRIAHSKNSNSQSAVPSSVYL